MSNEYAVTPAKEIWDTLSAVNVNEHTEEKMGLTYLSWAWAWGVMMKHYPNLHVEWAMSTDESGVARDAIYYPGGTASVQCRIIINGVVREMWLPVMDHKNKSIVSPTSRDISDAKMRCLVKCFAMFGLGHYIYAGEDLPSGEDIDAIITLVKRTGKAMAESGAVIDDEVREETKKAIRERDPVALKKIIETLNALGGD